MRIDAAIFLCVPAPVRLRYVGAAAAIDALAVDCQPCADLIQQPAACVIKPTVRIRPDIQDHVAALADAFDQLADQHGCGLIVCIIGVVAPVVVHRRTQLPRYALAAHIADALRRQDLFGADKVAAIICGLLGDKTAEALAACFQPIVNDDVRLMAAYHPDQICRPPRLAAQLVIGIIEPENVDPAVIRDQLLDLSVHIGKVAVKVDLLILICGIAAHGMIAVVVFWEIRVMPVDQGVVQAHAQPLGAHRVHKFPHEVAPAGGVRAFVVRQFGIKQAKAVMVLGCQYDILHPCPLRAPRPISGVIGIY